MTRLPFISLKWAAILFLFVVALFRLALSHPMCNDCVVHAQIAQDALRTPTFLLDIWGRPGFTLLYLLPAQLGLGACHAFSAFLSLMTGLLVAGSIRDLPRTFRGLAFLLCAFQATYLQLSLATLTETVCAFVFALGLFLDVRHKRIWAALAFSWMGTARLEAMPMLALIAIVWWVQEFRRERRERNFGRLCVATIFLGLFPVLWNFAKAATLGFETWIPLVERNVFVDADNSTYGSGAWHFYILHSWRIHGPIIAALMLIGIPTMILRKRSLAPVYLIAFYALQSALWAGGFFRTGGYLRFFVSVAPAAALAATYGAYTIHSTLSRRGWRADLTLSVALVLTVAYAVIDAAQCRINTDANYQAETMAVSRILDQGGIHPDRPIISMSPYAVWKLGHLPWDGDVVLRTSMESVAKAEEGTWILYAGYSPQPYDELDLFKFYVEPDRLKAEACRSRKQPFLDHLRSTRPEVEEIADFSITERMFSTPETEKWPYFVKLFVRTNAPWQD